VSAGTHDSYQAQRLGFPATTRGEIQTSKKIPETDAIFAQLRKLNRFADLTEGYVRLSLDAKASIKVGPYSRGGLSRRRIAACDHDFAPKVVLKLFGILLPAYARLWLFFSEGAISPDFMVDQLVWLWPDIRRQYHPHTLVLTLDNGPETSSHRLQLIKRLVEFARRHYVSLELAYYPPYHSKYNAIERVWGIWESHWHGELLDSREKVLELAQDMRWKERHPSVRFIPKRGIPPGWP
jgi:transposase